MMTCRSCMTADYGYVLETGRIVLGGHAKVSA
jgi:ABC-type branched-subunit amino acid transport system ATPase component